MSLKNRVLTCVLLVGSTPIFSSIRPNALQDQPLGNPAAKQVDLALEGLWSADNEERQQSKTKLIKMGEAATPSLIRLLRDLIRDRSPRYAHVKENGIQTVKLPDNLPDLNNPDVAVEHFRKNPKAAIELARTFSINERLKQDLCEILGSTKAEAAIPALIEMMWTEDRISANWELFNPAMDALITIGASSVPELIYAIEKAESMINIGFGDSPIFTPEAKQRIIKTDADELRVRAAMVLGKIGDKRALPVLDMLLYEMTEEYLALYVRRAIEEVKSTKN